MRAQRFQAVPQVGRVRTKGAARELAHSFSTISVTYEDFLTAEPGALSFLDHGDTFASRYNTAQVTSDKHRGSREEGASMVGKRDSIKVDEGRAREWLAFLVISLSFFGIFAASAISIWLATASNRPETTRLVFAAVIPLFGTWGGTVLAYYFARENFKAAAESTQSTFQLSGQIESRTPARQVMIPRDKITSLSTKSETADDVTLHDLYGRMTSDHQRIPILDSSGAVVFVVHKSTLDDYLASVGETPEKSQKTVADLVAHDPFKSLVKAIAVVGPDDTIAHARTAMRAVPSCNDVFVTTTGKRDDPILGWLTNTDLAGFSDQVSRG